MAGKRHFGSMDHVMHNKLSRLELASQRSTACFGLASAQDLQTCQNLMAYSMPNTDGHGSFNPWSSTAAYMQYTDSARNEHLQTREASVKYQRPHVERPHNPLQLSDNSSNQVPVHQSSPVRGYHMACPRACPSIAMPRPVYRSPSNFIDAAYGTRGFQSLSSQPLCPPAVEWTSARFAHPSSPLYDSGTKKHFSTPTTYPEVAGSPSSLSQSLQEQNYVYRHRADTGRSVGVSSAYPQKDVFTDAHNVAQQNVHLLYAEGNVPLGRQRSSAFTTPSPKHSNNKSSAYEGSLDHRLGNLYSKNLNGNTTDSIHHRSSQLSCSTDLRESPQSLRGSSVYPQREHHMHSGYVNAELRAQTSHHDGTLQASERPFQGNPSTHKTITEIPMCSPHRDKNLWVQSGQMNRYVCGMPSRADKPLFDSSPTNRSLQERSAYQEQSAHASFVQQSSSSITTPNVSSHEFISGHHARRHSVALEKSSLYSSVHAFEDRQVTGAPTLENTTESRSSVSNVNLKHAESTVLSPSSVSRVDSQYQMNHNNVRSRHDAATLLLPNCELPGSNMVDTADPKSAPTISEDVCFDNPKSPPMPVINDVFSLAPYRAYLEGKAPHPFATNQESEVEDIASASAFLEAPLAEDRAEKLEVNSSIATVVHAENVESNRNEETVQTGEAVVSVQNTDVESGVLDLSLKKLPQTGSSACQEKDTLRTNAAETYLGKAEKQIQGPESKMFSDTSKIFTFDQKSFFSQASSKMLESSEKNCSPVSNDRLSSGQEKRWSSEKLICHRQKNISQSTKTFPWQVQEYCQSLATVTQKNNAEENSMSLAHKSLSNRNQEVGHPQEIETLPSQNKKNPPSQMTECSTHQLQKNHLSQVFKSSSHNIQGSGKSHSNKGLPHQPQDKYSSQVAKNFPQQDLSSSTSQTLQSLPAHTSVQHPSHSNFSVFLNTMQTQTTIVPVMLASPPTVYFTNTIALHTSQPSSIKRPVQNSRKPLESSQSLSSPSGSENESNAFHSSKSFMFRKYKMKKLSSSEEEPCRSSTDSVSQNVSNPFPSDTVQSLPPSAPESSPALGEANVSLASVGEPSRSSSGHQFSELHRSVHRAIASSVARSHSSLLEDWLSKTKEEEMSKTPVKTKNTFRSNDPSSDLPGEDIWLAFDGVRLRLHKLLSQLETFMFTRKCPFPNVIRAGAIFIPIHVVKEVLFPELSGPAVDRVLQKHKVELRPTTLSEEKLLRETKLKDCPSRMLKLLALKQLPDIYPDLLCLFCRHTIQQELGSRTQSGLHTLK